MPGVLSPVLAGLLGALIGSFANVVIYRLPLGKSIVYPGSQCPHCGYRIQPWQNVPVLSWLALRGRCVGCGARISVRYPLVEAVTALGFVLLTLRWPLESQGLSVLPLLAIFAMLVMMSFIDIDHFLLPDSLTLPALAIGLLGPLLYVADSGLPNLPEAALGAAVAAGIIALINRIGSLVLRRFGDTRERLWPIGMDQVNLATLGGALGGWVAGLALAALSLGLNLLLRRPLRLPEAPLYALWALALAFSAANPFMGPVGSVAGSFVAAGAVALLGASFWWFRDMLLDERSQGSGAVPAPMEDEPVAMGFGDVKLAAVLGAMLGWQNLLVALFLAFVLGAAGGVIGRLLGGERVIPFGPYLALGGLLALFTGPAVITWYLGLLGFVPA